MACVCRPTRCWANAGRAYERMALPFRDVEDAVGTYGLLGAFRFLLKQLSPARSDEARPVARRPGGADRGVRRCRRGAGLGAGCRRAGQQGGDAGGPACAGHRYGGACAYPLSGSTGRRTIRPSRRCCAISTPRCRLPAGRARRARRDWLSRWRRAHRPSGACGRLDAAARTAHAAGRKRTEASMQPGLQGVVAAETVLATRTPQQACNGCAAIRYPNWWRSTAMKAPPACCGKASPATT